MARSISLLDAVLFSSVLVSVSTPVCASASPQASATLEAKGGSGVSGTVVFSKRDGRTIVSGTVNGLTPGEHGFHVHETGDCSLPDASSAGGHFNPTNQAHAGPHDARRHVGDLGNLIADDKGVAKFEISDDKLELSGEHSIIGRSLIVHERADDLKTQPSGGSGNRIACAVIRTK